MANQVSTSLGWLVQNNLSSPLTKKEVYAEPKMTRELQCGGETHHVQFLGDGQVKFLDHKPEEFREEEFLQAFGGDICPCAHLYFTWKSVLAGTSSYSYFRHHADPLAEEFYTQYRRVINIRSVRQMHRGLPLEYTLYGEKRRSKWKKYDHYDKLSTLEKRAHDALIRCLRATDYPAFTQVQQKRATGMTSETLIVVNNMKSGFDVHGGLASICYSPGRYDECYEVPYVQIGLNLRRWYSRVYGSKLGIVDGTLILDFFSQNDKSHHGADVLACRSTGGLQLSPCTGWIRMNSLWWVNPANSVWGPKDG